jgi:hypothetical protein
MVQLFFAEVLKHGRRSSVHEFGVEFPGALFTDPVGKVNFRSVLDIGFYLLPVSIFISDFFT